MILFITKVGRLHLSGPADRKRWRIKFSVAGESKRREKCFNQVNYDGVDEARAILEKSPKNRKALRVIQKFESTRRDAEKALARWLQKSGKNPENLSNERPPSLVDFTEGYLGGIEPRYRKSSLNAILLSANYLCDYFGTDIRVDEITPRRAKDFYDSLVSRDLADATLKHHLGNVSAIFREAAGIYPDHIKRSPFSHITIKAEPAKGVWKFVLSKDVELVIENCPADNATSRIGWQTFIALQRFAGLRKGEAESLLKKDVDYLAKPMVMKVDSIKTARSTGERYRLVPVLFPLLERLILKAIADSDDSDPFLVSSKVSRKTPAQRTTLRRACERAGIEPWKPSFQILRACCEYDMLKAGLPEALYTSMIGHSPEVSRKHYLAKFQGAHLDAFTSEQFKEAAKKMAKFIDE